MRQFLVLFVGVLMGTISTLVSVNYVLDYVIANNEKSHSEDVNVISPSIDGGQSVLGLAPMVEVELEAHTQVSENPYSFGSVDEVRSASEEASSNPSVQNYTEILQRIQFSEFSTTDIPAIEELEADLVLRLREQVKIEFDGHYKAALASPNYKDGSKHMMNGAGILAQYPMTEDADVIEEARLLSERHNDLRFRLESIRKARYNTWAAKVIENALKILRDQEDNYRENSLKELAVIESSLLEPSTSALYSYAIDQLMNEYKAGEKANVAKALNDPAVKRKTMEAF